MKKNLVIIKNIARRVRHLASTYSYLAGVRGNGQSGTASVSRMGVTDSVVVNSAFLALRSHKESFSIYE